MINIHNDSIKDRVIKEKGEKEKLKQQLKSMNPGLRQFWNKNERLHGKC